MSRRLYGSNAERQRAYRERRGPTPAPGVSVVAKKIKQKRTYRPARIRVHADGIRDLAEEYQDWRESLPPNLANGEAASYLEEYVAHLHEVADLLESKDPPLVGR